MPSRTASLATGGRSFGSRGIFRPHASVRPSVVVLATPIVMTEQLLFLRIHFPVRCVKWSRGTPLVVGLREIKPIPTLATTALGC